MALRYLELFAGAGGLSLGLDAAGLQCVARAEIEPHARAVLRQRWPNTPLHGDVTQVDWTQYRGRVELVSGGSPCQDLSLAGKRAGLGGARSVLFYELVRAWDETGAPYLLWENVNGARSSNTGADFAAVLSALVGGTVPVPARWTSAGVVAGATGVAAWRVLDLQHFGPPQRRRRVFVVAARTGGCDPAQVLALDEGVCGHPPPRQCEAASIACRAAGGVGSSGVFAGDVKTQTTQTTQTSTVFAVRGREGGPAPKVGVDDTIDGSTRNHVVQDVVDALPASLQNGAAGHNRDKLILVDTTPTRGSGGRPRRLTPLECERLMGWPDQWTATGTREDGTTYALPDSARYRLCGNGVGTPVAAWIGRRLVVAHDQSLLAIP